MRSPAHVRPAGWALTPGMRIAYALIVSLAVLATLPVSATGPGSGRAERVRLDDVDLSTIRGFEARFHCEASWCVTLSTSARWSFENGWVDQLGSAMGQDPQRVNCDFINHLTPHPKTAFAIVAQLTCLPAGGGSEPVLRATVLITFVVDAGTGVIREGLFLAATDADVELVVV